MKTTALVTAAVLGAAAFTTSIALAAEVPPPTNAESVVPAPRLVLQITVDQLRGDLPGRYSRHMGLGGFRYLMDHGIWFADAHHAHANTETIVGHTTLATGADPAVHGMIGNIWLDRQTGTLTYNIEDPKYRILTAGADVNKATEIDPTQKVAKTDGRSPAAILCSTFSDELAISTAGRARIFGVSVKDRGAVSMAGHAGKAFWFSKATGDFVTSTYYYDRYPAWVDAFNQQKLPAAYSDKSWDLLREKSSYTFGDADDKPWETDVAGFGRVFPHPYGPATGKYFTTRLTLSPAGDDLTLAFAKTLIDAEQIGQDSVTDYLSVSFSSTDYVGHVFSPSSLEAEDNLLRLDRTLADLFAYVDTRIGLKNVLIVLSADHGGPEAPEYLNQLGIPAKYVTPEKWDKEPGIAALKQKFGVGKELIEAYRHPYVYLNREVIREKGLDQAAVEMAVAAELMKLDGVALAVSSTALREGNLPSTPILDSVLRNFNPQRLGDIFVVHQVHCFINDFDGLTVACTHGSPWSYDTFVPVVFAGGTLTGQRVDRRIETVDVATTLAAFVGAKPPSGARSGPLPEVMQGRKVWANAAAARVVEQAPVTAIDILLEPDATMLKRSEANNARLLGVFPKGYALDEAHRPHITMIQCFVRTADLDKVYAASERPLAAANVNAMKLDAFKYYYVPSGAIGLAGICAKPTAELLKLQAEIIAAVKPFMVETGPLSAFTAGHDDPATDAMLTSYVSTFVPKQTGANFNPHVSTGTAPREYLDAMLAEPFEPFTFSPAGAAVYQLGPFGTAAKKLKEWNLQH